METEGDMMITEKMVRFRGSCPTDTCLKLSFKVKIHGGMVDGNQNVEIMDEDSCSGVERMKNILI